MKLRYLVMNIMLLLGAMVLIPLVSADAQDYALYCLQEGQQLDLGELCNPDMDSRTGPTTICMHKLDNGKECPANPNICNTHGLTCSLSGNATIDQTPPELEINSPVEDGIYDSRSVLLEVDPNEISSIYFIELNSPGGRWKQVCTRCSFYSKKRSFSEGLNELMFRAKDITGNEGYFNRSFFIDTKDPRIRKVEPRTGYASGMFMIEFTEENPKNLIVYYGNNQEGYHEYEVDFDYECILERNYECTTDIDLSDYDGQEVSYHVELEDIAGVKDSSPVNKLEVDYTKPEMDLEYEIAGKHVMLSIEVNEEHFDHISYIDKLDPRGRIRNLCTRLLGDLCKKRISFKDGDHEVEFSVMDEAGNYNTVDIDFFTDSRDPQIGKTSPRSGFIASPFTIEFKEKNPEELILYFGNDHLGFSEKFFSLDDDCVNNFDRYRCSREVDVSEYDGKEIEYYFSLVDKVGNSDESKPVKVIVDTTFPEINSVDYEVFGSDADLVLNITETFFDEAVYINHNDFRPRERRLCSRLDEGICEKTIRLNEGVNSIDIQVLDEAGNSVGINLDIET